MRVDSGGNYKFGCRICIETIDVRRKVSMVENMSGVERYAWENTTKFPKLVLKMLPKGLCFIKLLLRKNNLEH